MDRPSVGDLIDFLRNQTPPPDNYMSIPDRIDNVAPRSWKSKFDSLRRRRKSAAHSHDNRQLLRLPDSAVAGTTIGGHRHIAISIPIEYSPFGPAPRCQYPVHQHGTQLPNCVPSTLHRSQGDADPVLRFTNNRGVVTVLKTVSETQGTSVPSAPAQRGQSPSCIPRSAHGFRMPSITPQRYQASTQLYSHQRSATTILDVASQHGRHLSAPTGDTRGYNSQRRGESLVVPPIVDTGSSSPTSLSPRPPCSPPQRHSTSFDKRHTPTSESIDGIMNGQDHHSHAPLNPQETTVTWPPGSYLRSVTVTSTRREVAPVEQPVPRGPVIPKHLDDGAVSSPTAVERRVHRSTSGEPKVQVITCNPLESSSSSADNLDRRLRVQKVRDRKRRDVEASRASQNHRKRRVCGNGSKRPFGLRTAPPVNEADHNLEGSSQIPDRNTVEAQSITPLLVVANVEPSTPPQSSRRQSSSTISDHRSPASTPDESIVEPATLYGISTCHTPSRSPRSALSSSKPPLDRISLARRREWSADHHRVRQNKRERIATTYTARMSNGEVIPEYDCLREMGLQEMERRIHRLERSRDVWLRAIVPVLENLNKTLVMMQNERQADIQECRNALPLEETGCSARSAMLSRKRSIPSMKNAVMGQHRCEGDAPDDGEGSVSVVGAIEPVMRELQGGSRSSLETTSGYMRPDEGDGGAIPDAMRASDTF